MPARRLRSRAALEEADVILVVESDCRGSPISSGQGPRRRSFTRRRSLFSATHTRVPGRPGPGGPPRLVWPLWPSVALRVDASSRAKRRTRWSEHTRVQQAAPRARPCSPTRRSTWRGSRAAWAISWTTRPSWSTNTIWIRPVRFTRPHFFGARLGRAGLGLGARSGQVRRGSHGHRCVATVYIFGAPPPRTSSPAPTICPCSSWSSTTGHGCRQARGADARERRLGGQTTHALTASSPPRYEMICRARRHGERVEDPADRRGGAQRASASSARRSARPSST